jgi:methionyl-tRNA synthetase
MAGSYFLTTAIDYVNSSPHLGHAYEKVLADFFARHHRSLGQDVLFLTGVDEHGQKVQQSAQREGIDPKIFCDTMSARFQALHKSLVVDSSEFVRTTDPRHQTVVREWLQTLHDRDEIVFQEHEGYYSVRQEQFVTEKDQVDGKWPEIFGEVIHTREPNYYFRLEPYRARLKKHLEENPDFIAPAFRRKELFGALEQPLADLCISRPKSRLAWGIPLPFNEDYVTYVWFDALVNYYSFAKVNGAVRWPPDLQIIGKDILIPAHGVYWPIMLMALNLALPRHLLVHGFWTNSGAKISKSDAKSLVDPVPYIEKFGPDALRYFVLREMVLGQDADFSDERFEIRYTADLAKGLGNLTNRTLSMIARYREGKVPTYDGFHLTAFEEDLRSDAVVEEYGQAVDQFAPHLALQAIWKFAQRADKYVEETAPFKLAKDPAQARRLDVVLGHLAESVRRLSVLVQAALPFTAEKMRAQMNLPPGPARLEEARFGNSLRDHVVGKAVPLFPPLEEKPKP